MPESPVADTPEPRTVGQHPSTLVTAPATASDIPHPPYTQAAVYHPTKEASSAKPGEPDPAADQS